MKKQNILWYQMRKVLGESFIYVMICGLVYIGIHAGELDDKISIVSMEAFLTMTMMFPSENMSLKEYIHFGFCRKEYYKKQILLCAMRAGFYAMIRSTIHSLFYLEFVADLIEGTSETASMYHSVSCVELFLGDFLGLFLMMLLSLATNSFLVSMTLVNINETTPQLLYRREEKKKKNTSLFKVIFVVKKCVWFVVVVAAAIGMEIYYQFQIQSALKMRMLVMGVLALCCVLSIWKEKIPAKVCIVVLIGIYLKSM